MTTEPIQKVIKDTLTALREARSTPVRALRNGYILAVVMLIGLGITSHTILRHHILENSSDVRVVNAGAFLKTSSQRIALLARNLVTTSGLTERENIRREILRESQRVETVVRGLLAGDETLGLPEAHSPEVHAIFYRAPLRLENKIQKFLEEARALAMSREVELSPSNAHLKYLRKEASGDRLLADLEVLVRQYQAESEARLYRLQDLATFILLAQMFVLLLMALFIFRPLAARVGRQIEALNVANEALKERVAERTLVAEQRATRLRESERLALLDPLTEVLNRRGLQQILAEEAQKGPMIGFSWSVLLIDLDDFKSVNDRYGHAVGDHVLREVASILRVSTRPKDLICRVGGDEFLVLMPQTSTPMAMNFAEKIRRGIEDIETYAAAYDRVCVSASIGLVALASPNFSVEQLLTATHSALYRSKSSGKNRISFELEPRLPDLPPNAF